MVCARRVIAICCGLLFLSAANSFPLSKLRPGQPRIKFVKLEARERAKQGDIFKVTAFITPLQNIWERESAFLHIIKPDAVMDEYPTDGWTQKGIVINADFSPVIPSERWIVGEEVMLGPINFGIPHDMPPGKYLYQIGLFYKEDPTKKVWVREPYVNREIKDWILGTLEVKKADVPADDERVETVISDFEELEGVKRWESMRRGRIGLVSDALDGEYSGLFGFPARAYLPKVMIRSFFENSPEQYTNWNSYDYFQFLLRGTFTDWQYDASNVSILIKDSGEARFQRNLKNVLKVPLKDDLEDIKDNKENISIEIPKEHSAKFRSDAGSFYRGRTIVATGPIEVDERGVIRVIVTDPQSLKVTAEKEEKLAAKPEVILWRDAGKYVGQTKTVVGTIVDTYLYPRDNGNLYLNFPRKALGENAYVMRLSISDIGGKIDTEHIRELAFFAGGFPPTGDWYLTITVDDIKLVAEKGFQPRWTEPFIVFEGLECPKTAVAGEMLELAANFSIARKFRKDYNLFIHLIQKDTPYFFQHLERKFFESPVFWNVGQIYHEGPIRIPISHKAPPGKYMINIGIFRTYDYYLAQFGKPLYVNIYKWSDGVYIEDQPKRPTDWIKQPYLNATSKTQWTVGEVTILARGKMIPLKETEMEKKELKEIIAETAKDILPHQPPIKSRRIPDPSEIPSYEIKEE